MKFLQIVPQLFLIFAILPILLHGQDIIFDDDDTPRPSASAPDVDPRRPQFGFPFQRPRPLESFGLTGIARNPIEAFASGLQSFVQNFVNPAIGAVTPPTTEAPPSDYEEPVSDCQTFRDTNGFCMPLDSCDILQRFLANRPQISVNRILRRSFCGVSGFTSLICCPEARGNIISVGPAQTSTRRPFDWVTTRPTARFTTPTARFTTRPTVQTAATTTTTQRPRAIAVPNGENIDIRTGCGFSNASHSRIVGGREAQIGAWPWLAALGYTDANTGNTNYLCGGALVGKRHILTAAHCTFNRNDLKTIRLGDHDLFSDGDGLNPLNLQIEQTRISPSYNSKTQENDIAIILLRNPVEFTPQVHPICLPASVELRSSRFENNSPFVAGWGAIGFNGPSSAVLRETQLPIVPDAECQAKYADFKNAKINDRHICAGLQRGGRDACQGDSGGPLMQPLTSEQYVQIGIVSYGFKCAEPNFPGVYTRVTSHMDWIEDTIRSTS